VWHNIPRKELPKILKETKKIKEKISIKNWHRVVLNPEKTEESMMFIIDVIEKYMKKLKVKNPMFIGEEIKNKWTKTIKEIADLENILIH
jgi:hypothetical protein